MCPVVVGQEARDKRVERLVGTEEGDLRGAHESRLERLGVRRLEFAALHTYALGEIIQLDVQPLKVRRPDRVGPALAHASRPAMISASDAA